MKKAKLERSPWVTVKKKPGPKKVEKSFDEAKKTSAGGEQQGFLVQPVRFSITASAAEKFEDDKSDSEESNISSESKIEDAGDNPATFAVVYRLKLSSEASCTESDEKCVPRVSFAGAASFMFCVYLPFSSLFWFRRWLSRARLNFSHREIALQYYSNTKSLQNSPGNASLCLTGRRRKRVDKYFNEVRKLGKCFKTENTAFVFARIPHL